MTAPQTIIEKRPGYEVADAIYAHYVATREPDRAHLGGSEIGAPCARRAWLGFRWAYDRTFGNDARDEGRMLRLFQRGHREESFFFSDLRALGAGVYECDPRTGKQWRFTACGGHFGCSLDGVIRRFGNREWGLVECKTSNAKAFIGLQISGVREAKPQHWFQIQTYLHLSGLRWALYMAVNKDNDDMYTEIVEYDAEAGARMLARAEQVVFSAEPPERISNDPADFRCKFCPAREVCFGYKMPRVNARTCAHSTPMPDGTWRCELCNKTLTLDEQRDETCACGEHHVYIPALIAHRYEHIGSADSGKTARLRDKKTGREFNNGTGGVTSLELKALGESAMDDAIESLRAAFGGRIVEAQPDPNLVDGAKVIEAIEGAASWARPDKDKLPKARARR